SGAGHAGPHRHGRALQLLRAVARTHRRPRRHARHVGHDRPRRSLRVRHRLMDLEFTDEQDDLRATTRSFLEPECPMRLVREVVEKGVSVDGLWEQMVALGWPALTVPETDGGL